MPHRISLPPRKVDKAKVEAAKKLGGRTVAQVTEERQKKRRPKVGFASTNVAAGQYLYFLHMRLEGYTLASISAFLSKKYYTEEQWQEQVDEGIRCLSSIRILRRREEMEKERVPVSDPEKLNQDLFKSDVEFVESVLCDKNPAVQKLLFTTLTVDLEPTIRLPHLKLNSIPITSSSGGSSES